MNGKLLSFDIGLGVCNSYKGILEAFFDTTLNYMFWILKFA